MRIWMPGALALGALWLLASAASAGPIEKACLASGRASNDATLCACVQQVADITLNGTDQRLAAKFFTNPDKAEAARMQSSAAGNAFWQRYLVFGQQAEMACQN